MTGFREYMNQHPKIAVIGGCVVAALAVGLIVVEVMAGRHRYPSGMPEAYYSDDDGKTYFADDATKVPPFDHDGKQAVMAFVFECGGSKFVGYLQRYNAKYHDYVVAHGSTSQIEKNGLEFKQPGDSKWYPSSDLQNVAKITNVLCPDGTADVPQVVLPGQ